MYYDYIIKFKLIIYFIQPCFQTIQVSRRMVKPITEISLPFLFIALLTAELTTELFYLSTENKKNRLDSSTL